MKANLNEKSRFEEDLQMIFEAVEEATIIFGLFADTETFTSAFAPDIQNQVVPA